MINYLFKYLRGVTFMLIFVTLTTAQVNAQSVFAIPSCTISVTPSVITSAQSATLKWDSTEGALFAELDNGIGSTAPDGEMIVSPDDSTVYTLHTWNSRGEGGYCSVALTVNDNGMATPINSVQPTVTLQTLAVHPAATRVVLSAVPYTGPMENAVYTFFLFTLVLTAGYVAIKQRKIVFA